MVLTRLKTGNASWFLWEAESPFQPERLSVCEPSCSLERGSNQTPALLPLIGYFPPEQEPSHQQHEASL